MGSSNLVQVTAIKEVTYGQTPVAGNFSTARFTSESLSGSPQTVESKQIRTDRMSSGQIVTGLNVQGGLNFELAKESMLEDFLSSAMCSDWNVMSLVSVQLAMNHTTKEVTRGSGSWIVAGVVKGDVLTFAGFVATQMNTQFMVAEVVSATVIRVVPKSGVTLVTETAAGASYKRADKLTIGTSKISFSMQKRFLDLTNKAIVYRGMMVSNMELNVNFGSLIEGSFNFSGNDHAVADLAAEMITDGRTINAPATSDSLNGSIDMPFLASDAVGTFNDANMDIRSVGLKLNNNLSPQNVIGDVAPRDYSQGTARVEVDLSAYLKDNSWDMLEKRLTQQAFALGFMVQNLGGFYGFYMPAIQVSFDDPNSGGQDQDVILQAKGQAKVGANQESSLTIYRG